MFNFAGAHVHKFPSGRFGFVGRVPVHLAYEYDDAADLETARICGAGFAMEAAKAAGRTFKTRTWGTEADALAAARGGEG